MLINTFLDTEDFVHLYYPEDEPAAVQGCGAGARMASKYPPRPPSPEYSQTVVPLAGEMGDRERFRAPPQPEPPPHRVRAADLYPRLRTHYDEPGLDAGFTPICGEFVQWVGRTADGGTIAMSNYRLHVQPLRRNGPGLSIPLRLMDAIEIRDLLHLMILCKNGRPLQCSFSTGEQCLEWWRRLNKGIAPIGSVQETFAAAYAAWAKEQPPTSVHRELMKASLSAHKHWFGPELERLGFTERDAWRVTTVNTDHKLCPSYPPLIIVPGSILDEDLDAVARFRAMRRVPAVVWRHRGNGAVIARSSQPEVGWLGWRSNEDERLLAAFVTACNANRGDLPPNKQLKLLIVDARSYASAVTNRARGGGCECQQYYPAADIQFMSLPNIHHVRKSFHLMRALAAEPSDITSWYSNLERTLWLQYVSGVLRAATVVSRAVESGRPVLVHCSDGWDRTPQIVATAQLILDPFYRTLEGFRVLIEREWLDFGHKFADRCGHTFGPEDPNERSPIFLQWLDVVHQMQQQFPCSFEFNEAYLIKLGTHVHSCMFGTFLCNTSRERTDSRVADITPQVWHLLRSPAYRNHLYTPHDLEQEAIWPEFTVRSMCVWSAMFCAPSPPDEPRSEHKPDPPAQQLHTPPTQSGLKTKTRSCDNLLCEGEKRTTQRRSSDPNLAPDVKKLSKAANGECENRRDCRAALTDSCVDELPILPLASDNSDTVDGLHPDHFENSMRLPRDLASGSSSLERELGGELTDRIIPDQVIDHADDWAASDSSQLGAVANNVADVVTNVTPPDVDTPEEPPVFVPDTYSDDIGMPEAARGTGRIRTDSITWRSVSESSNQSFNGFVININESRAEPLASRNTSHDSSPLDNHTSEDRTNHNVVTDNNHSRENSVSTNGIMNGLDEVATNFHEVDLNGGATSSSISSESEGEAHTQPRRTAHTHTRTRVASQLTLCPTSPRRIACCHCSRRASNTSGVETSGASGGSSEVCWCGVCGGALGGARVLCVCGGAAPAQSAPAPRADPLDGLPPALDPLQARLHQIILYQKKVVDELSGQLREAREALRMTSPAPAPPPAPLPAPPPQTSSGSGSVLGSGSSSGSASEVEVGEEARGVVWVPDSAAPRCQYCRNHFWLARRRHHCRRCGGIFCGSCSEMSSSGDCGSTMRLCRRCR